MNVDGRRWHLAPSTEPRHCWVLSGGEPSCDVRQVLDLARMLDGPVDLPKEKTE